MPSRAYTPFLPRIPIQELKQHLVCQCPLGLIPHIYWSQSFSMMHITWASVSMPSRAYTPFLPTTYTSYKDVCRSVNALSGLYPISTSYYPLFLQSMCSCQCPLGLIPHFYYDPLPYIYYYESSCQCPLGLIPHFYGTPSKT